MLIINNADINCKTKFGIKAPSAKKKVTPSIASIMRKCEKPHPWSVPNDGIANNGIFPQWLIKLLS